MPRHPPMTKCFTLHNHSHDEITATMGIYKQSTLTGVNPQKLTKILLPLNPNSYMHLPHSDEPELSKPSATTEPC